MSYNYFEAVKADVHEWVLYNVDLSDWEDRDDLEQYLNDRLFTEDNVTGNATGSYTCNAWQAEENLAHNWDEIETVASEYGYEPVIGTGWENGPESWDVRIRCYYLSSAISEVLDDFWIDPEDRETEPEEAEETAVLTA